jgi:hypothetical protein
MYTRSKALYGRLRFGARRPPGFEAEGYVLSYGQVWKKRVILEHHTDVAMMRRPVGYVLAVQPHVSDVRCQQAGNDAQQRCLAAARRPEQRDELAALDAEIDAAQHPRRGERLLSSVMLRKSAVSVIPTA